MDADLPVKTPTPKAHDGDDSTTSQFDSQVGSQFEGSQFSEKNPLTTADPSSFKDLNDPKKPQAVAFHGWQRTVGVDEDFDPTIPVRLGAPGTGLSQAKVPPQGGAALGPALGRGKPQSASPHTASFGGTGGGEPESWDELRVTQEDKKEAKSLRALPVAPGAAPLPFPRVVSESDESSVADSLDSLARRQLERRFETQSSSASSDLSFLVNTAAGSIFGTRPTFGRAIEPRIPATVGEERLHNSLAQYFSHNSRRLLPDGESSGDLNLCSNASHDKERSERETVSSTPVTKAETRESSLSEEFPSKGSRTRSINGEGHETAGDSVGGNDNREAGLGSGCSTSRRGGGLGGGARKAPAGSGSSRGGAAKRSSSAASTDQSMEDVLYEEGRIAKPPVVESEQIEPGQRMPVCGCFRTWPWKIMMGFVMFVAVVAVVVVINSGGSLDPGRRLTLLPNGTLSSDPRAWGVDAALPHSKRMLKHSYTAGSGSKGAMPEAGSQEVMAGAGSQGGMVGGALGAEAALTHKNRMLRHSGAAGGGAEGVIAGGGSEGDMEGGGSGGGGQRVALKHSKRVRRHSDTAGGGSEGVEARGGSEGDVEEGVSEGGRQPPQSLEGGNTSRRRRGLRVRSSDVDKSRQII